MSVELHFGQAGDDLDKIAEAVEACLNVKLEGRYSDYWGGAYFLLRRGDDELVRLFHNEEVWDEGPVLNGFPFGEAILILGEVAAADAEKLTAKLCAPEVGFRRLDRINENDQGASHINSASDEE